MNHASHLNEDQGLSPAQVEYRDSMRLMLLKIFHYILGAFALGSGVIVLFLIPMGLLLSLPAGPLNPMNAWSELARAVELGVVGKFTMILNLGVILGYLTMGLLGLVGGPVAIMVGRRLDKLEDWEFCRRWSRRHWWLLFPHGIPLGICLKETLERESIKARFSW